MPAFSDGNFGVAQRLPATDFIVLGLLTFWVYSVLRFAKVLDKHFKRRWSEVLTRDDLKQIEADALTNLQTQGFTFHSSISWLAAGLFTLDGILVLRWFMKSVLLEDRFEYGPIILTIGSSSFVFYIATIITMIWASTTIRRHEIVELLIYEQGISALKPSFELGGDLTKRWERTTNLITLFLVIALPMTFSPTIAAHLFYSGINPNYELWLPASCFIFAIIFHVWGTMLLVGLYNQHLEIETQYISLLKKDSSTSRSNKVAPLQTERELTAIMMTDMYGYSKQMEQDEVYAYAKLLEHNRIIRTAIANYRGREIKTIGDAFLVTFRSAVDAVDCALMIQRSFADFNVNRNEVDHILVRIGIHLGDVLVVDNDVYGDSVNIAARIEPLAEPGGICVSEPVFELVRKKIQFDVQKIESSHLKNIKIAPNIYKICLECIT